MRVRTHTAGQDGFSIVEILIVLVIIAVIGFVGYTFYSRQHTTTATNTKSNTSQASNQPAKASDVSSAPAIHSTSDLDKAAATLDQTDPDGSNSADAGQLDSQTANF